MEQKELLGRKFTKRQIPILHIQLTDLPDFTRLPF